MSKILIVDDEARIRDIIKTYLEFDNFEVEEAENGEMLHCDDHSVYRIFPAVL